MPHVRDQVRINAPADRVWALLTDATRLAEWQSGLVEVKDVSGSLDQVGSRYTSVIRVAGRPIEGQWEVTKAEPNRLLELRGTAPAGGRATTRASVEPADGGTDLSVDFDYEPPTGFLAQFASRLFVERAIERAIRHSNENFKALVEEAEAPTG
jgi:uncharacterized membrane protein